MGSWEKIVDTFFIHERPNKNIFANNLNQLQSRHRLVRSQINTLKIRIIHILKESRMKLWSFFFLVVLVVSLIGSSKQVSFFEKKKMNQDFQNFAIFRNLLIPKNVSKALFL
jgi:hypothetical protein